MSPENGESYAARKPSSRARYKRVSTHETEASAFITIQSHDAFSYVYVYNNGPRGKAKVYRCVEHQACNRYFRLVWFESDIPDKLMFAIEKRGDHTSAPAARKRSGIHPALLAEVDAAVLTGGGPLKVRRALARKYTDQQLIMDNLPKESQIKSRKSVVMGKISLQQRIASFADLNEWVSLRLCNTTSQFFSSGYFDRSADEDTLSSEPSGFQNGTIVLKCFRHFFEEDGIQKESYGLIMTSRRVFRNVLYTIEGQDEDGILAAADGTYKLHYGGWVLVALGTYRSRYKRGKYSKTFLPWAYMFVRTEHQYAYTQLFTSVKELASEFFRLHLNVKFGSLDHAACIANAFKAVWPGITLMDCWAHVSRKCRENMGLLNPVEARLVYYDKNIKVNVNQLHKTRSPAQFKSVAAMCLRYWRAGGQDAYASWFEKVYLHDDWSRWYATSGAPGIVPSQNPLEAHNKAIKTCSVTSKRAKTGMVLNDSIPGVSDFSAQNSPTRPVYHYCEGPIPSYIIHRAAEHVETGCFFRKRAAVNHKRPVVSVFFNSSRYMRLGSAAAVDLTTDRVEMYAAAKRGELPPSDSVTEINLHYLSLHEVEILDLSNQARNFILTLEPIVRGNTIKAIRSMYRCDCKKFWTTGSICSHVVATMHIFKQFDITVAKRNLPTTKLSGGQRKIPGALYVDNPDSRTFSVPALTKRLLEQPHYPHGWKISTEILADVNGEQELLSMIGRIDSYAHNGGIYKWLVIFPGGQERFYHCEELAELLVASRKDGLDVTCSARAS